MNNNCNQSKSCGFGACADERDSFGCGFGNCADEHDTSGCGFGTCTDERGSFGCGFGTCVDEHDLSGCSCGSSGRMLMLSTIDGQELPCRIICIYGVNEMDYIALQSARTNEVLLFRYFKENDGTNNIDNIKSEDEFDRVSEVFKGLFENVGFYQI